MIMIAVSRIQRIAQMIADRVLPDETVKEFKCVTPLRKKWRWMRFPMSKNCSFHFQLTQSVKRIQTDPSTASLQLHHGKRFIRLWLIVRFFFFSGRWYLRKEKAKSAKGPITFRVKAQLLQLKVDQAKLDNTLRILMLPH